MESLSTFVLSKEVVFHQVATLEQRGLQVTYSWKTNPVVGKLLCEESSCFMSVHGPYELAQVPDPSRVWYFGFAWDEKEVVSVLEKGVRHFVLAYEDDIAVFTSVLEKRSEKVHLLLRMRMRENTIFTGKHYVWGMPSQTIVTFLASLGKFSFIEKIGIHFHRKTQNVSEWSIENELIDSLGEEVLQQLDYINIGGGLPACYKNIHDRSLKIIFEKIDRLVAFLKRYEITPLIEPGRFIAAPSCKLETTIVAVHEDTIFVDCSIFNGMLDTVVADVKLMVEDELPLGQGNKYVIKGSTPDSCDILRYSVYLPKKKRGDTLVFLQAGAYTYTTNFCALKSIPYRIVDSF